MNVNFNLNTPFESSGIGGERSGRMECNMFIIEKTLIRTAH